MPQPRTILHFLTLVATLLFLPTLAAAQSQPQPNPCVDWGNVQNWTGTINVSGGGTFTDPSTGTVTTVSESGTVTIKGTAIDAISGGPCHTGVSRYQWYAYDASVISNVSIHDRIDTPARDIHDNPCTLTTTFDIDGATSKSSPFPTIYLDFTNKSNLVYNVGASLTVDGVAEQFNGCGSNSKPVPISTTWGPGPGSLPVTPQTTMSLPPSVTNLAVSVGFPAPGLNSIPANWTVSGTLVPFIPSLDVIVVIPQYDTWRPIGGVDETDLQGGNGLLGIQACLIRTDKNQIAVGILPDGWTFNLAKVSHEPGVALNWPPQSSVMNPSPPDMAFPQALNQIFYSSPNNLQLSGETTIPGAGTTLQLLDPLNTPAPQFINLVLSPFDWGAWAVLNVTALVNGNQVPGHLGMTTPTNPCAPAAGQAVADIRLPKRQDNSYIADSWKSDHGIDLVTLDNQDPETIPGVSTQYPGDGLTLYEEYRGIYADCPTTTLGTESCVGDLTGALRTFLHVEGDPKKLDLFVVNDSFPEVLDGIKAFQAGTGIKICCDTLQDDEINGPDKRVINFNFSTYTPREGDQHAILIVKGADGAPPCTQNGPDKPQNIPKIYYPSMANVLAKAWNEGKQARVNWAQDKYPFSVAHEIGHSVAVSHHGTGDIPATTPQGLPPYTWLSPDGVSLVEVPPGGGASTPIQAFYENNTTLVKPSDLGLQNGSGFRLFRGTKGGQHSGDIMCFMRYNVSQTYLPLSDPTGAGPKRFYVPERELAGRSMTNTSEGTGTNYALRTTPQSRYWNSDGANKFGMCLSQICINDRLVAKPLTPPITDPCPGQTNP